VRWVYHSFQSQHFSCLATVIGPEWAHYPNIANQNPSLGFFKLELRRRCLFSWVAVLERLEWSHYVKKKKPVCSQRKWRQHAKRSRCMMGSCWVSVLVLLSEASVTGQAPTSQASDAKFVYFCKGPHTPSTSLLSLALTFIFIWMNISLSSNQKPQPCFSRCSLWVFFLEGLLWIPPEVNMTSLVLLWL
jgi:hypothetical protein